MLIGMQLRPIWERLDDLVRLEYCSVAACVLATVIVTRVAWVITYGTTMRFLIARGIFHPRRPTAVPTVGTPEYDAWAKEVRGFGKAIWEITGKGVNVDSVFEHPGEATFPVS